MLHEYHHVSSSKADAAFAALDAGLDIELPFTDSYGDPLREAVQAGTIPEELVNVSLRRALAQKFALGLFDNPYVSNTAVVFDTAERTPIGA